MLNLQNCSSVKVLDSWKSDKVASIKDNNFLLISRTVDNQARITFENEIVNQLEANDYQATASFTKFPKLNLEPVVHYDLKEKSCSSY